MVTNNFSIKIDRLDELKKFIRDYLPTARFISNPFIMGNYYAISLSMNVDDSNKLNELFNKWYDIDNYKEPKKGFLKRIFKFLNKKK